VNSAFRQSRRSGKLESGYAAILERSRRGKRHAARAGSVNVLCGAPFGYRYVGKHAGGGRARYEIHEEHARIVRQLFAWVGLERCSIGEVCRRLQAQQIPRPKGKPYWDRTTVWGILKNPAYKGQAQFGKTQVGPRRPRLRPLRGKKAQPRRPVTVYDTPEADRIAIEVPALVSEEVFAAVAERLQENRRRCRTGQRGARYLLQGLLVCGSCGYAYYGKPLSRSARKGKTRDYAYYRCIGTDAYRFAGQRLCQNKQVRTDLLEEAVWDDVCALLREPERVEEEYQRRLSGETSAKEHKGKEQLDGLIQKVKRGIARLIDAYSEGLLDKSEFEPRIRRAKDRLAELETQAKAQADREEQQRELRLVIGRLQEFAERVHEGLNGAVWSTRREIIRTLVKRIEISEGEVRVIYKVDAFPFVDGPEGGLLPHCWRSRITPPGEPLPALCVRQLDAEELPEHPVRALCG
jgi:site-specific DNA recombinase